MFFPQNVVEEVGVTKRYTLIVGDLVSNDPIFDANLPRFNLWSIPCFGVALALPDNICSTQTLIWGMLKSEQTLPDNSMFSIDLTRYFTDSGQNRLPDNRKFSLRR